MMKNSHIILPNEKPLVEQARAVALWLSLLPNVKTAIPMGFTIGEEEFYGAKYERDGEERFYILGYYPKSYTKNRGKVTFAVNEGRSVFYIAGGFKSQKEWAAVKPEQLEFHPFGPHFYLHEWKDSIAPIDAHSPKPYKSIPFSQVDVGDIELGYMNRTRKVLGEMLKERIGTSIFDSGSIYGRHQDYNKDRNFESEQPVTLNFESWKQKATPNVTYNLYYWLSERIAISDDMDKAYQQFIELPEHEYEPYDVINPKFMKHVAEIKSKQLDVEVTVAGANEEDEPVSDNSANSSNYLEQDINYTIFSLRWTIDNVFYVQEYIILQIHNGADIRSGYTKPRIFEPLEDIYAISFAGDAKISCKNGHSWTTENASNWRVDVDMEIEDDKGEEVLDFNLYPVIDFTNKDTLEVIARGRDAQSRAAREIIEINDSLTRGPRQLNILDELANNNDINEKFLREQHEASVAKFKLDKQTLEDTFKGKGLVVIDEENNGYCPHCGKILFPC